DRAELVSVVVIGIELESLRIVVDRVFKTAPLNVDNGPTSVGAGIVGPKSNTAAEGDSRRVQIVWALCERQQGGSQTHHRPVVLRFQPQGGLVSLDRIVFLFRWIRSLAAGVMIQGDCRGRFRGTFPISFGSELISKPRVA